MNATQQAHNAYGPAQHHMRPPRAIEAQLFSEVTRRLAQPNTDFRTQVAAVQDNRRMWTTLAADVAAKGNALPKELRAQIFYLAEFTDVHSRKFLRGEVDLTALIDINTAIMRGLEGQEVAA